MKSLVLKGMAVFVFLGFFAFSGCASKAELYEFVPEESNASISFKTGSPGVRFVSYNGRELPDAGKGSHWDPIVFPAGTPIQITVRAYYEHQSGVSVRGGLLGAVSTMADTVSTATRGVNTNVVFTCPPLRVGIKYQLSFDKASGIPGTNTLVLTELGSKSVIFEQEFDANQN